MAKQRERYAAAVLLFIACLAFMYSELRNHQGGLHMPLYTRSAVKDNSMKLQFPASFPRQVSKRQLIKKSPAFRASGYRYSKIIHMKKRGTNVGKSRRNWTPATFKIFGARKTIDLNMDRCGEILDANATVSVSPKRNLNLSLTNAISRLIREIDRGKDDYLQEFKPYLDPQIRLQVSFGVVDKHWFTMAGSSVYLKEYGYHMMVSRLAYSPNGLRNNPKFSFVYSQLFDTAWNEVNDIGLIVPSNVDGMGGEDRFFAANGTNYTIAHYPAILPVPFFHDYEQEEMKYLGPEDARVILVQSERGHEEPLIIYNTLHQKQTIIDDDEDEFIHKPMTFFRSMWVSWPWQFQRGKQAVEDLPSEQFDTQIYQRVKELQIKNVKREKTQKNWTPLVSESSRLEHGYDKHLFFVYRWAHLQILKCEFTSENGKCGYAYTVHDKLKVTSNIGPLRGGTPMVSINQVLGSQVPQMLPAVMPQGREIWVGFARAHLHKCGCGREFYRPNLVVLVKDSTPENGDLYRLSHISSFTSLNLDIIPWDPKYPLDLCEGTNAIIPNAMSQWVVRKIENSVGRWKADDTLSLAVSVSDCTVDVVHIHGLLSTLLNLPGHTLFYQPLLGQTENEELSQAASAGLTRETVRRNDNIACAMEESTNFCAYYGMQVEYRRRVSEIYFDEEIEAETEEDILDSYRLALDEVLYR